MFGPLRALADKRSSARNGSPAVRAAAERYLTDGINLYRVVAAPRGPRGRRVVGVEDCRSLELILLPADEFRALKLRPVRPAAAN